MCDGSTSRLDPYKTPFVAEIESSLLLQYGAPEKVRTARSLVSALASPAVPFFLTFEKCQIYKADESGIRDL